MNLKNNNKQIHLPNRLQINWLVSFSLIFLIWLIVTSFINSNVNINSFIQGIPNMASIIKEMLPPDISRLPQILKSLYETFLMAIAGTFLGIVVSLPLSLGASRMTTPNKVVYVVSRFIVSFCRTVPDLVWALFFVATVGLGAFAGVLTLMIDTIGFCGRFFAEGLEEVDTSPKEALEAIGASFFSVFFCALLPSVLPSFINSILFSLEKAVRSSVVLGLVGAGGIGMELKVSMESFRYDQASTIIILIFILVLIVERISSFIRKKIIYTTH